MSLASYCLNTIVYVLLSQTGLLLQYLFLSQRVFRSHLLEPRLFLVAVYQRINRLTFLIITAYRLLLLAPLLCCLDHIVQNRLSCYLVACRLLLVLALGHQPLYMALFPYQVAGLPVIYHVRLLFHCFCQEL